MGNIISDTIYNVLYAKKDEELNKEVDMEIADKVKTINTPQGLTLEGVKIDLTNCRNWKRIVIHHAAQKDSDTYNDWAGIKKYQMSWRYNGNVITEEKAKELIAQGVKGVESPDLDIAYHFGYEHVVGQPVLQIGRPLSMMGAHTKGGYNVDSIGWCSVGNFDSVPIPDDSLGLMVRCLKSMIKYFNIPIDYDHVLGHWESFIQLGKAKTKEEAWTNFKTCPGKTVDCDNVRKLLL